MQPKCFELLILFTHVLLVIILYNIPDLTDTYISLDKKEIDTAFAVSDFFSLITFYHNVQYHRRAKQCSQKNAVVNRILLHYCTYSTILTVRYHPLFTNIRTRLPNWATVLTVLYFER